MLHSSNGKLVNAKFGEVDMLKKINNLRDLERLVEHFEEVCGGGCQVLRGVARIVLQGRLVTLS